MGARNLRQNSYLFRDLMICGRFQLLTVADMYGLFVVWNAMPGLSGRKKYV
jgi:hypothetical protein